MGSETMFGRRRTHAALLVMGLVAGSLAVGGAGHAGEHEVSDALRMDAEQFAADTGIPVEEVLLHNEMQPDLLALKSAVEGLPGFAGVWWSWQPLRANVAYAGEEGREAFDEAVATFPDQDRLVVHSATWPMSSLEWALGQLRALAADGALPQMNSSGLDVIENLVFVTVLEEAEVQEVREVLASTHPDLAEPSEGGMVAVRVGPEILPAVDDAPSVEEPPLARAEPSFTG